MTNSIDFERAYAEILSASNGALLVPIAVVAQLLGIKLQTVYNRIYKNRFPLNIVEQGSLYYVRATEIARFIVDGKPNPETAMPTWQVLPPRRRGRPKKEEGIAATGCK